MKKRLLAVVFIGTWALASASYAGGKHDHSHAHEGDMEEMSSDSKEMFLEKRSVDGYEISFHVMRAKPGKEMGGSHDFMVKVEKGDEVMTDIVMNTKVIYPNGQSETKKTMKMGDWYMAGYDLMDQGKHQLMILFKTADGQKHKAGLYYTD